MRHNAREYIERLKATKDPRILFPGAIYGAGYRELQSHAYAYIQATEWAERIRR
jgi:hypothetical protein